MVRLKRRINDWAKSFLWEVPQSRIVKAEFALQNQSCHHNSVMSVYAGRADKVWMVWAGGDNGCLHFINSKGGKFFDETCFNYDNLSYRVIRAVKPSEFDDIGELLNSTKRSLISQHGSAIDKLVTKFKGLHYLI